MSVAGIQSIKQWAIAAVGTLLAMPVVAMEVETHGGTLSADTVWKADAIHKVTSTITVPSGITLTVEPGAIVKFNSGQALNVNGVLDATGTEENNIIFTSYRDDIGGDTNGDGPSVGQPGDWYRVYFGDSVVDNFTKLEHSRIRFGGSQYSGRQNESVYLDRANITISNSEIVDGFWNGLYIYNSHPLV
ncbi:MAG: hypothetical protein ACR2PX_04455, partial [Endozoicomonas sp.]